MSGTLMRRPSKRGGVYGGEASLLIGLRGRGGGESYTVVEVTNSLC